MKTPAISNPIKCDFDPEASERCPTNPVARALWAGIKSCHLTDQNFLCSVYDVTSRIEEHDPETFEEFMFIIKRSGLSQFGSCVGGGGLRYGLCEYDEDWWRQMWRFVSGEETLVLVESKEHDDGEAQE